MNPPLTIDQAIERLTQLKAEHGGDMLVAHADAEWGPTLARYIEVERAESATNEPWIDSTQPPYILIS